MSCELSIIGTDLDIDIFINKTKMSGFKKFYKGEAISKVNPKERKYSFVSITTSEASFDDIKSQIDDTIAFLNKHQDNLRHIVSTPEIEYATINFGVNSTVDDERLTQSLYLPISLIKICAKLGIGIELSFYKKDMEEILERKKTR